VSVADAIVNVDENLGNSGEPELAVRSGVVKRSIGGSEEAVGEDFGNTLEGCVCNGALRSIREVREEDGVRNGNGVGGFKAFGNSDGELAKGNRDRRHRGVRDEGFHQRRRRKGVENGGERTGERRQLGEGIGYDEKVLFDIGG